jgi:hypothetical protein
LFFRELCDTTERERFRELRDSTPTADTATTLCSINKTLHNLGIWVPQVDESIKGIHHSLAAVDTRLNNLEADRQQPVDVHTLGKDAEVMAIPVNTTLKLAVPHRGSGRRDFPNTPVNFELGEHSGQNTARTSHFIGNAALWL